MTIGSRLRKLREKNNLTQEIVAEYINYTTEGYIKLEEGKEILRVDVLLELCKLYNCSEAYILHGEENITNCMKKNETMKVGNLPVDFGEKEAKKSMKSLNNIIDDILHGDHEDSNEAFNESFIKTIKDREKQKSIEITDLNQLFEGSDIMWVKIMNMLSSLFNTIQSYKDILIEYNKLNIQKSIIKQKQRELNIDISNSIGETVRKDIKDAILTEIHYQIYLAIKQLMINTNLSITLSDGTTYSTSREIITNCKVAKYISQNLTKEFNNYITDIICNEEIETVPDYLEYRYTEENKQVINILTTQFDKLFKQQYSNVDLLDPPKEIKDIQYNIKT